MSVPLAPPEPDDLLTRHRPALDLFARLQMPASLRTKLDPADLVQRTLLDGHRDRDRLLAVPGAEQAAFLRRILCNRLIDAIRKHAHEAGIDPQQSSARLESWLAADDSTPSERMAREERWRQVAETLAELPETQRQAVEFKYLHEMSVREIAERMGCTESAVGGLLRRGVRLLRERLCALSGEDDAST